MNERFLLDTHILIWTLYEPERLSHLASGVLENAANKLFLSDISLMEILNKAVQYRLPRAGFSVDTIVGRVFGLGLESVSVLQEDIIASAKLPQHHGDPLDRLLIAQAQRLGATLLSKDRKFKLYDVPILW